MIISLQYRHYNIKSFFRCFAMKNKKLYLGLGAVGVLIFLIIAYFSAQNIIVKSSSIRNIETAETYGLSFKNRVVIFLKEIVFPFKNQQLLKELVQTEIASKDEQLYQLGIIVDEMLRKEARTILYEKANDEQIILGGKQHRFIKFTSNFLTPIRNYREYSHQSSYVDFADDKLFFATTNGVFSYVATDDLGEDEVEFTTIPSNLPEFIGDDYEEFFLPSLRGLRDILIDGNRLGDNRLDDNRLGDNHLYISYLAKRGEECWTMAIAVAQLNIKKLEFSDFFMPEQCAKTPPGFETGGRIEHYKDNQFLYSFGYAAGKHQDVDSFAGKIIAINKEDKTYRVVSMGHRNPQGLYYDKQNDLIFSSEHGPKGGDELNLNISPDEREIENYGWPISSYGRPYNLEQEDPYKKSHKDYGFIEPLKDFTPSIGPSQIIGLPEKFNGTAGTQIILSSLGGRGGIEWGNQSLNYFLISDDNSIATHDIKITYERIRDIIYVEELNKVFISFETTKSFGILEATE